MALTEKGELWVQNNTLVSDLSRPAVDAEYWISAFIAEVERRADDCAKSSPKCPHTHFSQCRSAALKTLKRELLGDIDHATQTK